MNARATEVLGTTEYRTLSTAYGLEGICASADYVLVKIVAADGAPVDWEEGWIERKYVAAAPSADVAAGLLWDIASDPELSETEKAVVRRGALRVLRDDPNCGSVVVGARSGQRKGEFFVTCRPRSHGGSYNVWFSPSDVDGTAPLLPPKP